MSGGSKPYQIKWSDPLAQVGNLANRLATGSYFINITDAKGCALQHQVLMTSPLPLQMNIQTRNLTCLNKNDGDIEVFPVGGSLPYQLLW
ncbi:MAG: SprB repeat-containing protein, partial [Saprospiraceae bacterium]|nr:SprB repeat-containing protein [Saprospiraceae bacterium]